MCGLNRTDSCHEDHSQVHNRRKRPLRLSRLGQAVLAIVGVSLIVFIAVRIIYTICYLTDRATLRTLCWTIGYLTIIGIFLLPVFVH